MELNGVFDAVDEIVNVTNVCLGADLDNISFTLFFVEPGVEEADLLRRKLGGGTSTGFSWLSLRALRASRACWAGKIPISADLIQCKTDRIVYHLLYRLLIERHDVGVSFDRVFGRGTFVAASGICRVRWVPKRYWDKE